MYQERDYRKHMKIDGLTSFNICVFESDLQIFAGSNLEYEAKNAVIKYRQYITGYIKENPLFLTSLVPIEPKEDSPEIILDMCRTAKLSGVGPMAAVAGAVSKYVGRHLLGFTDEVIVENGGDIYIRSQKERKILIYAGSSVFSNKLALLVPGGGQELGICTSSGTVGHSLSFGKADAAVIVSEDAVLADAVATATGNIVKGKNDIEDGIEFAMGIEGIKGVVIIVGDKMGACGEIKITKI